MPVTLKLVTPVKVLPPQQAHQVTFSASDGEIGVRQGHAPLAALVGHGVVEALQQDGTKTSWAVRGGVAQVLADEVNILVIDAIEVSAIDPVKIQARLDAIASGGKPDQDDEAAWLRCQLLAVARAKSAGKR